MIYMYYQGSLLIELIESPGTTNVGVNVKVCVCSSNLTKQEGFTLHKTNYRIKKNNNNNHAILLHEIVFYE